MEFASIMMVFWFIVGALLGDWDRFLMCCIISALYYVSLCILANAKHRKH